ncbi:MAG: hypothetical protein CSA20_07165 [Deltaproteobacteria bacterium]|nr:MAG: hypothetical protein CSA20_07165 [Deltaproteobacteria bacterium]
MIKKAREYIKQQKYREAITCLKQAGKAKHPEDTTPFLEQAYTGRILELSDKAMFKEALILLKNMCHSCPDAQTGILQLTLFIRSGNYTKAAKIYPEIQHQLTAAQRHKTETLFAALAVSKEDIPPNISETQLFPADELHLVRQAIKHFSAEEDDEAANILRSISFRSKFKELRLILAGLMHLRQNSHKAAEILSKASKDSPYAALAASALPHNDSAEQYLQHICTLLPKEQVAYCQQHLPKARAKALADLAGNDGTALNLLQFIRKHEYLFSQKQYRLLLRNIVPFSGYEGARFITGVKLDANKMHLMALAAEHDGAFTAAGDLWTDYLDVTDYTKTASNLEKAAIYRHMAHSVPPELEDESDLTNQIGLLRKALTYDREHVPTWIELADKTKKLGKKKQYYAVLNEASTQFPDNVAILLLTMRAAAERGAHKKASTIARQVLDLDPINTAAQDFIVASRLEHGRKLAAQKKWDLAKKELLAAGTRTKSYRLRGRYRMALGMLLLLQKKTEEGLEAIHQAQQENGIPVLAAVLVVLESRLFGLPVKWQDRFVRELKQAAVHEKPPSKQNISRLTTWLNTFPDAQQRHLYQICQGLSRYFSRITEIDWSQDEGLVLCKTLCNLNMTTALLKYAKHMHKAYPGRKEYKVWSLLAQYRKKPDRDGSIQRQLTDLLHELDTPETFTFVDEIYDLMEELRLPLHASFFPSPLSPFIEAVLNYDLDEEGEPDLFPFPDITEKGRSSSANSRKEKKGNRGQQLNLFGDDE